MARADYGSWSKFNGKIVTEKEQLEIINKVKKADNVNYYADAILYLCDGKYILSYFKGYYFTLLEYNYILINGLKKQFDYVKGATKEKYEASNNSKLYNHKSFALKNED